MKCHSNKFRSELARTRIRARIRVRNALSGLANFNSEKSFVKLAAAKIRAKQFKIKRCGNQISAINRQLEKINSLHDIKEENKILTRTLHALLARFQLLTRQFKEANIQLEELKRLYHNILNRNQVFAYHDDSQSNVFRLHPDNSTLNQFINLPNNEVVEQNVPINPSVEEHSEQLSNICSRLAEDVSF